MPKGQTLLKGDRLNINGLLYTVSTIDRLQGKLHHNNFNERSNKDTLVFGGVLSEYHELSNWAPAELYYNGVKHKSIEHAYMHTMGKTFKDEDTAADIMDSPDAQSAKMLSHKVNGFDAKKWNDLKYDIMFTLLRIKFKPGSKFATKLLATGNKHLAESGRGFYACGLSITDNNVLDKSKWSSNQLGILLEKLRHDLHVNE